MMLDEDPRKFNQATITHKVNHLYLHVAPNKKKKKINIAYTKMQEMSSFLFCFFKGGGIKVSSTKENSPWKEH